MRLNQRGTERLDFASGTLNREAVRPASEKISGFAPVSHRICTGFCTGNYELVRGKLLISVKDARPFAPHMSCGSRATQEKPEALVILFRAKIFCRYLLRMAVGPSCTPFFVVALPGRPAKWCVCRKDGIKVIAQRAKRVRTSGQERGACCFHPDNRSGTRRIRQQAGAEQTWESRIFWRLTKNTKTTFTA